MSSSSFFSFQLRSKLKLRHAAGDCSVCRHATPGGSCSFRSWAAEVRQANTWTQLMPSDIWASPVPRQLHAMVWSESAEGLYLFGGENRFGPDLRASQKPTLPSGAALRNCR